MDQGSNKNHSPAYNFTPTVTKFCVMWEGLSLPHDTKFDNCRCKIVDSRSFHSWSLIHGLRWSGLIKVVQVWSTQWSQCTYHSHIAIHSHNFRYYRIWVKNTQTINQSCFHNGVKKFTKYSTKSIDKDLYLTHASWFVLHGHFIILTRLYGAFIIYIYTYKLVVLAYRWLRNHKIARMRTTVCCLICYAFGNSCGG